MKQIKNINDKFNIQISVVAQKIPKSVVSLERCIGWVPMPHALMRSDESNPAGLVSAVDFKLI